jgi:hypothetical protein
MSERSDAAPIFIVGAPRSGTTLLRLILDSHSHISCGPETHLIAGMDELGTRHWRRLKRFGHEPAYWHGKARAVLDSVQWDYAEANGKVRWAEKTPSNALHMPFLDALYPDAQVIHMIRDARMVTASAYARWGWRSAWDTVPIWGRSVAGAMRFGASVPSARYREIRFEQLMADVEGTARGLFAWLGEPWEPEVLDYDRFSHDGGFGNTAVSVSARSTHGGAIDSARAATPRRTLDPLLSARLEHVAGRLNRSLGYR